MKIKSIIPLTILTVYVLTGCNGLNDKTKKTLNEGGEAVGKTATEFIEGVSKGVESTLDCEIVISENLQNKGIKTGNYEIVNDPEGGKDNLLTLYLIYDKDIKTKITAKAFNKNGLEIGRSAIDIEGKSGEADYVDFKFNKRTEIGVRSKIVIE